MRKVVFVAVVLSAIGLLLVGIWVPPAKALAEERNRKLELYDNCDPNDPAWAGIAGGCVLDPREGDVSLMEFGQLLTSTLSASTVGHPSWRMEPSYMTLALGKSLRIENEGGRDH